MEKKPFTLRLAPEAVDRLEELSNKHLVSKQNILNIMIADFDDTKPENAAKLLESKYAKYKSPVRRQVDKLAELINNEELGDAEREELRRLLGEA